MKRISEPIPCNNSCNDLKMSRITASIGINQKKHRMTESNTDVCASRVFCEWEEDEED